MSNALVPISEAKARLSELVREAETRDIILMRHGRPAAYLVNADAYDALVEQLEDAMDRLSVYERDHSTIDFDKVVAELGLDD